MTGEASGEIATGFGALPGTPVGRQVAWWLGMVADQGARAVPEDRARYTPALQEQLAIYLDPERQHEAWRDHSSHIGTPAEVSIERAEEHEILAVLTSVKGRKWALAVSVEAEPPHRMDSFRIERRYDFKLDVREGGPDDALIVSDIERRSPIVKGETSTWFERGDRYFDFTRLMDEVVVGLASVDGEAAAVTCGAVHEVRVGGAVKTILAVSHLRVLPEHQRKGLWGAANRVLDKYWPAVDGSSAFINVDNEGMQHGFTNTPDKWPQTVLRVDLDCAALAGPMTGRPATSADAGEIVRRLNAFHDAEELFVPCTEASFAARVTRAHDLYGWERVWLSEGAVVGVWPAGEAQRSVTQTGGVRHVTNPAIVLDYAYSPGAEAAFEALIRAWCGWLGARGMDALMLNTSPASTGADLMQRLARRTIEFNVWTPGIPPPEDAAERGLYADTVYF
jgi:hypothetical protein